METEKSNIVLPEGHDIDILRVIHEVGMDNIKSYQIDISSDFRYLLKHMLKGNITRNTKIVWGTRECGSEIGIYDKDIKEVYAVKFHIETESKFNTLFELSDLHFDNEAGTIIGNMRMIDPFADYSDKTSLTDDTKHFIKWVEEAISDRRSREFYKEHTEYTPTLIMA